MVVYKPAEIEVVNPAALAARQTECMAVTARARVGWQATQIVVVVELAKKVMK